MEEQIKKGYSISGYILYKMDRTIAVIGLVMLGGWSLQSALPDTSQIAIAVVGALAGYIGGRSGGTT